MLLSSLHYPPVRHLMAGAGTIAAALSVACGGAEKIVGAAPVASVSVAISSSLVVGAKTQAIATTRDDAGNVLDGRSISWSSSNTELASVSPTGEVTALRPGAVEIKATSEGKDGWAPLSVIPPPVASVGVSLTSSTLSVGSTTTAAATLSDASGNVLTGRTITWSSSDVTVATVNDQGVVTGLKAGTATITATSEGKSGGATVTVNAPSSQVKQRSLSLGANHVCGIAIDGDAYCWGFNHNGQLGNRSVMSTSTPLLVTGGHKFSAISAGRNTTYAVTAGGELYCWGGIPCDPSAGNPIDPPNGPAVVSPLRMATARTIEVLGPGGGGYEPMCASGVGNVAYCWGANTYGALGIGFISNDTVLVPDRPVVGNHAFAEIAAQHSSACALTTAGAAYCWGAGTYGALGDGSGTTSAEPRAVAGNHVFKMIGVAELFACGLTTEGKAYCWGNNQYSYLGATTGNCLSYTVPCSATPVAVSGGHVFESLASSYFDTCGVTSTGDIYCWGRNFGSTPARFRSLLADEPGGVRFKIVAIGANQMCAIATTGDAWCRYSNSQEPVMVPGGIKFRTP